MNIYEYAFHKCPDYWICNNPVSSNWFVCRQKDPSIIVEFDLDTQTGRIVGMGNKLTRKIQNRKQYAKELAHAIEFIKDYVAQQNQ